MAPQQLNEKTAFARLVDFFNDYHFLTIRRRDGSRIKLYAHPETGGYVVDDYESNAREWLSYMTRTLLAGWGMIDEWEAGLVDRLESCLWAGQGELSWESWWQLSHNKTTSQPPLAPAAPDDRHRLGRLDRSRASRIHDPRDSLSV